MSRRLLPLLLLVLIGCGLQSRPRSPGAPASVGALSVSVRAGSPVLSWRGKPAPPLVRFQVQRRKMPADPNEPAPRFAEVAMVPIDDAGVSYEFVDNELDAGDVYQYRVRAMPAEGRERSTGRTAQRYQGRQVTLTWDAPPAAPAGVDLQPVLGGIKLTWQPVPEASGYRVYVLGTRPTPAHARLLESPEFTDLSPSAGRKPYVVRAVRVRAARPEELEGPSSAPHSVKPVEALAPAPVGLKAVRGTAGVQLSWKPAPETPEATRFHVYRQSDPPERLTHEAITVTTFADGTAPGGAVEYVVRAVDALGREGPPSDPASP